MRDDIITCPRCGFKFSISYARAVACQGCQFSIFGRECKYIKCPKCGYEFALDTSGDVLSIDEVVRRFYPRRI